MTTGRGKRATGHLGLLIILGRITGSGATYYPIPRSVDYACLNKPRQEGNHVKHGKSVWKAFVSSVVFGSFVVVLPANAQDQKNLTGCCQFEGDEPGCWYPTEPGPCAKLDGIFLEGEKCDAEARYCSGYEKKEGDAKGMGK